jgi:hypothetical protein
MTDLLDQRRAIDQRWPAAFMSDAERHGPADALPTPVTTATLPAKRPA